MPPTSGTNPVVNDLTSSLNPAAEDRADASCSDGPPTRAHVAQHRGLPILEPSHAGVPPNSPLGCQTSAAERPMLAKPAVEWTCSQRLKGDVGYRDAQLFRAHRQPVSHDRADSQLVRRDYDLEPKGIVALGSNHKFGHIDRPSAGA